jgi:hypothetical protein
MAEKNAPLLQRLFAHVMSFGICVAMPAVVMMIMPVASTTLVRKTGVVSATTSRKVFFLIPFQTETVSQVIGVDDQYIAGTMSKSTPSGPKSEPMRPETRSEDMSWLVIHGKGESVEVPVSPANIDSMRRKVRDFLEDPAQTELNLFTVANWKISVITAGLLCILTLIYLGSIVWGLVSLFAKKR